MNILQNHDQHRRRLRQMTIVDGSYEKSRHSILQHRHNNNIEPTIPRRNWPMDTIEIQYLTEQLFTMSKVLIDTKQRIPPLSLLCDLVYHLIRIKKQLLRISREKESYETYLSQVDILNVN